MLGAAALLAMPATAGAAGNGRIAFTSFRDGEPRIYTMAADGSDVRRLTTTPERGVSVATPSGADTLRIRLRR